MPSICPDHGVCRSRFKLLSHLLSPRAVDGSFVSYTGIQGGFEELWMSGSGSAEEAGIVQRHGQACVEPSRGPEGPKLPLWALTGVQSSPPTSPNLAEGKFSEVRGCRVLGSSGHCPWGKNIRTSEAAPVKSGDRQPEQQTLVVP
jgi:hypothetical protein